MTTDLLKLAERCERATFPCPDDASAAEIVAIKSALCHLVFGRGYDAYSPDYTNSIDDALTLVPEWPNHGGFRLTRDDDLKTKYFAELWEHPDAEPDDGWHKGRGSSLPLALCAAALKARAASGTLLRENTEDCSRAKPSGPAAESGDAQ